MTTPAPRNEKRQRKKEGHQRRRAAELEALRRQRRNRMIVRFALVAGLILAIAAVLAFVGGDDDDDDDLASDETTQTTTTDDTSATTTPTTMPPDNLTCETPAAPQTDLTTKPTITPPAEMATDITCLDHVVGDGEEVPRGATISAQYVGVLRSDGTQFDASWDNGGEPIQFSLDEVIPGWTQGIPGMKVGGRRELIIPAVMAYGAEGRAPSIGPDEDLVFIVDVVDIVE
jgi:peptidylprolyl isomerase